MDGALPFLPLCLKMSRWQSMLLESFQPQLLPAALSSNLLLGVAPWQQAQPRAQEPCLCYLSGWMQPEEEKKEYYPVLQPVWEMASCSVVCVSVLLLKTWNYTWKTFSQRCYQEPKAAGETIFSWFSSSKQRVVSWDVVQKVTCSTVTCGAAMIWGCTARWLYGCFM